MSQKGSHPGLVVRLLPIVGMVVLGLAWLWVAGQYNNDESLGMLLLGLVRTVVPALGYVLPLAAAVYCWSRLLRRFFMPDIGLAVAMSAGLAFHLWLCWVFAWLGMLTTPAAISLALAPVIADIGSRSSRSSRQDLNAKTTPFSVPWPAIWLAMPVAVLMLAAAIPPGLLWQVEANGYDVLSYHLQLPREWYEAGSLALLKHNVYSAFPSLGEAGYMHSFAWFSGQLSYAVFASQFLHAACALLAAGVVSQIVFDMGQKLGNKLKPGSPTASQSTSTTSSLSPSTNPQKNKTQPQRIGDAENDDDEDSAINPAIDRLPMIVAAGLFLAMPWVLITGSLAYNEMFAIVLAGAGLAHALGATKPTVKDAALVGFLLGAGTMAKLTAGPMLAVPAVVILLDNHIRATRSDQVRPITSAVGKPTSPKASTPSPSTTNNSKPPTSSAAGTLKSTLTLLAVVVAAGTLVLSPYFIRNYRATSNPVFPFATSIFGTGHWSSDQARAWQKGHAPVGTVAQRFTQLDRHWLRNAGYGAFNGRELSPFEKARETRNVAVFREEFGVPAFWTLGLASLIVLLVYSPTRALGLALGLTILWQVVFWVFGTHIQSRFLIFSLLPGCALIGLATARLSLSESRRIVRPVGCIFIGFFSLFTLQVFWGQTPRRVDETTGAQAAIAACSLVGNLGHTATQGWSMDDTPLNRLPVGSKVMLVADASRLLYTHVPISYHSAFDTEPLGDILRAHPADSAAVTAVLKARGITHVWVHWSELDRLHSTYGYDKDVTLNSLRPIVMTWTVVPEASSPAATLFALP